MRERHLALGVLASGLHKALVQGEWECYPRYWPRLAEKAW